MKALLLTFGRWFDTSIPAAGATTPRAQRIDWIHSIPFLALHLSCIAVIWVGFSWTALVVAIAAYLLRMFAVTGFYHRYFSHRTYRTSRVFQFFMAALGNSSAQRGALWWAAHHRHHHQVSDQPEDLHSPKRHGFFWSHMGWFMCPANFRTNYEAIPDLAKYPELRFLNRFDIVAPALFAVSMLALGRILGGVAPGLGTNGWQLFVWGFLISTVALFHGTFTINSLAHLIGRRRYQTGDDSRNSLVLTLITLGEGWHNNHHHFPATAKQGFYWWEVDFTYYGLKLLSWVRLVRDLKPLPREIRRVRRLGDATRAA